MHVMNTLRVYNILIGMLCEVTSAKHALLYELRVQNMPGCQLRKYGWAKG
jgi:hypothetical protein